MMANPITKAYDALATKAKETGAALLSATPVIKEYIPSDWSVPEEPTSSSIGRFIVPLLAWEVMDVYVAGQKRGDIDRKEWPTVGPFSIIIHRVEYGEWKFGKWTLKDIKRKFESTFEKMDYNPTYE